MTARSDKRIRDTGKLRLNDADLNDAALMEQQRDAVTLMLSRMQQANDERVPVDLARRLACGESPLRVWREYRGLTVQELAARSGVSSKLIVLWQNEFDRISRYDGVKPDILSLAALADALEVDVDDLVPWSQD